MHYGLLKSIPGTHTYLHMYFADETSDMLVSNLTVRGSAEGTVVYSCSASNRAGTSEKASCEVTVTRKGERNTFWKEKDINIPHSRITKAN